MNPFNPIRRRLLRGALAAAAAVAGAADVLVTVLPGSPELADVMERALPVLRPGTTWIDLTSASPPWTLLTISRRPRPTRCGGPHCRGRRASITSTCAWRSFRRHRPVC